MTDTVKNDNKTDKEEAEVTSKSDKEEEIVKDKPESEEDEKGTTKTNVYSELKKKGLHEEEESSDDQESDESDSDKAGIDAQAEFLRKQKSLLELVSRVEKDQSSYAPIRPCNSCELPDPYPRRLGAFCWRVCPAFRTKKKIPKEFWIISTPGNPTPKEALENLKKETQLKKLSMNYKFHIPKLKVGTLDELIYLTEELKQLDTYTEEVIRKFADFSHKVLKDKENYEEEYFQVNHTGVETYITRFSWNPVKYGVKKPLSVLHDLMRAEIRKFEENLKKRINDFEELDQNLQKIEKQKKGNLLTRSLYGIVKADDFVLNSSYLLTLLVVVPNQEQKNWMKSYHTLAEMVVPHSSVKLFQDKTHTLYSVVLCRKNVDEFKINARKKRFIVRDFEYSDDVMEEERDIQKKVKRMKEEQIVVLCRWIKANFSDLFSSWMHVKAMQVFVETNLRYGLPSDFLPMILIPTKSSNKKILKERLGELYHDLDSELAYGQAKDIPGTLTGYDISEYLPYIFYKFKIDMLYRKQT
ncbi:v-type proton ATPase subunit C 1 [Trichonephila clavata]|uniref:V-type proton ATPase subunit C n=1 Tax=Trichonephila clavata TaxID=2740835 RepID=A0A8X6GNX1_TRICU|nr:v-type proton ATPase subunit C 1 [Trichonephila clavata]